MSWRTMSSGFLCSLHAWFENIPEREERVAEREERAAERGKRESSKREGGGEGQRERERETETERERECRHRKLIFPSS